MDCYTNPLCWDRTGGVNISVIKNNQQLQGNFATVGHFKGHDTAKPINKRN